MVFAASAPWLRVTRGVADAVKSAAGAAPPATVPAKASSRNTRAAMAGFTMFLPMPPKQPLTITTANTLPRAHCHSGTLVLRFSASSRPVTTADRSETVCFFPAHRLNRASAKTADATHVTMVHSAETPKITTPAIAAGSSAITTSSIMRQVEEPA